MGTERVITKSYITSGEGLKGGKPVENMYRNKPHAYFERILNETQGIMEVYTKDYNGDPGCPINGKSRRAIFQRMGRS